MKLSHCSDNGSLLVDALSSFSKHFWLSDRLKMRGEGLRTRHSVLAVVSWQKATLFANWLHSFSPFTVDVN